MYMFGYMIVPQHKHFNSGSFFYIRDFIEFNEMETLQENWNLLN